MSGLSLETRVSNLKSVALTVLELFTFYTQNFMGSHDPEEEEEDFAKTEEVRCVGAHPL